MKESALKKLLGVLVALFLVYAVVALTDRGPGDEAAEEGPVAEALAGVRVDSLRSVRIVHRGDTLRLRRRDDGWRLDGHAADPGAVEFLQSAIEDATVAELASRNPANHPSLGVTRDSARALVLEEEGGRTTTLLLGDRGPYGSTAYVRAPGSDEVYLLEGELRRAVDRRPDQWRDKVVARVDSARVGRIVVEREGDRYTLERSDAGWRLDGSPASGPEVRRLMAELTSVEGVGVLADSGRLASPSRRVVALSGTGDTLAEVRLAPAGEERRSGYRVTGPALPGVYELESYVADQLAPGRESLLASDEAKRGGGASPEPGGGR